MFLDREKLGEMIRFGIVGALATAVHYGIYLAMIHWTPAVGETISYTVGYIISFIGNFLASNYFTFKTKPTAVGGFGFAFSHGINYLLHIALLNLFLWCGIPDTWAPVPVFCIAIPVNFLLVRFFLKGKC